MVVTYKAAWLDVIRVYEGDYLILIDALKLVATILSFPFHTGSDNKDEGRGDQSYRLIIEYYR